MQHKHSCKKRKQKAIHKKLAEINVKVHAMGYNNKNTNVNCDYNSKSTGL